MLRVLPGVLALTLLLSACGGPKPVEVDGGTVRLRIDEYHIAPREIHVRSARVRIVMTDRGILTHNIRIFSTTEVDAEDKPVQIGEGTATAHPGETVTADPVDLRPGRYRLACSIANHDDLGEHAILVVRGRS